MSQDPNTDRLPAVPAVVTAEPLPPGGRSEVEALPVAGALPSIPGTPPVSAAVPLPAEPLGKALPGVQLSQRPRRRGDSFGWPANAAPGKPEGEVDTRG
ncbi:MAG: hypothetical protein QOC73_282 [Actinomycetota bacterium]|jgi:hypothetical protein|nr:hypothetical protein [Actinomycetota bacterium]MDQ1496194.1 hypothetical protein [Actinomycetota bacterium]MDQ1539287.1 hypothetical protein [Actinomycetota bacterium]